MLWTGKLKKKETIKPSPNQLSTYKSACASLARIITLDNYYRRKTVWSNGRTIRKLMGGGGEVQKKYSCKGELNEKKICMPINPKKTFMLRSKKNSYKEFHNKKKIPAARKSPPPPSP